MKPVIGFKDSTAQARSNPYFDVDTQAPFTREVCVFTDHHLAEAAHCPSKRAAWLVEPRVIHPECYEFVEKHLGMFDAVFTSELELTNLSDKVRWTPFGDCWIPKGRRGIYPDKSEFVSLLASPKRFTEGQAFRWEVADALHLTPFGSGDHSNRAEKVEWLAPYRYAVIIENCRVAGYFTEKLLDALVCGTTPLYRGDPLVTDLFETVVPFDTVDELREILADPPTFTTNAHYRDLARAEFYADVFANLWRSGLKEMV